MTTTDKKSQSYAPPDQIPCHTIVHAVYSISYPSLGRPTRPPLHIPTLKKNKNGIGISTHEIKASVSPAYWKPMLWNIWVTQSGTEAPARDRMSVLAGIALRDRKSADVSRKEGRRRELTSQRRSRMSRQECAET